MSDSSEEMSNLSKLTKKMSNCNKTINLVLDMLKVIDSKLGTKTDKNEMGEIFKKKQIGRPAGDFDTKRKQYLSMLNENKIKQPKTSTLEFYKIQKEDDKYIMMEI